MLSRAKNDAVAIMHDYRSFGKFTELQAKLCASMGTYNIGMPFCILCIAVFLPNYPHPFYVNILIKQTICKLMTFVK